MSSTFSSITGLTEFSRVVSSSSFLVSGSLEPMILSMVNPEPLGLREDDMLVLIEGLRDGGEMGLRGRGGKTGKGKPDFSGW